VSETEKVFCDRWFRDLYAIARNHNRNTVNSQAGIGIILAEIVKKWQRKGIS
jgi:hypothetical protein